MPDADDIKDAIAQSATDGIKRVRGDEGEVEQLSIPDQIAAAKFVAQGTAASKPARGIRFSKIVPPGASS